VAEFEGDLLFSNDGNPLLQGPSASDEANGESDAGMEEDDEG